MLKKAAMHSVDLLVSVLFKYVVQTTDTSGAAAILLKSKIKTCQYSNLLTAVQYFVCDTGSTQTRATTNVR
jgi:hypothetical protein